MTNTPTTKLAADLAEGDMILVEGRKRPVEVIRTWPGWNGTIEIAAWGRSHVALILPATEEVEVVA
jgi:hypothetical protein